MGRLAIFAAASLLAAGAADARDYPAVSVDYFALFDRACAEMAKQPVDEPALRETEARLAEFRTQWAGDEAALLGSVVAVTGVAFRFAETRAALVSCGFQSISLPLLVNVRPYLGAASGAKPAPMSDFSNTVFHEVLHRYVADSIRALPGSTTPLLKKYATEHPAVRNHMHLFAIERLVYRKVGRETELEASIEVENTLRGATNLRRARTIVAEEGAEALVRELKPTGR
jgi:hypothetical protein